MLYVDTHLHAKEDIVRIRAEDRRASTTILALLKLIEADPAVIDKLTTYGDNSFGNLNVNVKPWEAPGKANNLWRLRAFDATATSYRIVYGYQYKRHPRRIYILAVVKKGDCPEDFNYDTTSETGKRILSDWRDIQA